MAQPKHKIKDGVENDQIDETPRVSSVTGQDLVDLFNRLGCPQDLVDGMKGDDLGIYIRNRRARVGVCRVYLSPVSYTHLTLPTNREV